MKQDEWTTFIIKMTTDEGTEEKNRNSLNSLTNHFDRELKELISKYDGKFNLHIQLDEIPPC